MPPKTAGMPIVFSILLGVIYFLFFGGMIMAYIIALKARWRMMKAHEKIANKLSDIADKLQLK